MNASTLQDIFVARTHACGFEKASTTSSAGWFGGAPLAGWTVPKSVDGKGPMTLVATIELGAIDETWAGSCIALYVDPEEIGECSARFERVPTAAAPSAPRKVPARFAIAKATVDESWVEDVGALGRLGSKIGGRPGYLQHDLADEPELTKKGYGFFAQIDCEDGLIPSKLGSLVCDGGLYLFVRCVDGVFDFEEPELRWQY